MKHLRPIAVLLGLLLSSAAFAGPVSVRLETPDGKSYPGMLYSHEAGSVIFEPAGTTSRVRLPDAQVAFIKFEMDEKEEARAADLFAAGNYRELEALLNGLLSPALPYIMFPSNLTSDFRQWIIAAYWIGNYERVNTLTRILTQLPDKALTNDVRFYRGLALLETGDFQTVETFLKSPEAVDIYPADSIARRYIDARLLQKNKEYTPAIRKAALLMVELHRADANWMPPVELLCAELYFQLKMPESAKAVLADINEFYSDPQIQKKAAAIAASN